MTSRKQTPRGWIGRRLLGAATILLTLSALGAAANDEVKQALAMLDQVKVEMLTALRDPQASHDAASLRKTIDDVLAPQVDFGAASRLVLGEHWKDATPAQREQFVEEFSEFLIRFYATALNGYVQDRDVPENFMSFQSTPLQQKGNQLVIRSLIKPPSGAEVPIDYRLYLSDAWRVFDVSVNGMSLARNYRAGFDSTIRASGMDRLITDLAAKNAELAAP